MSESHRKKAQPSLIVVRGLPGSGKSHLAAALQNAIGADKTIVLDPDATDYTSQAYRDHTQALAAQGVDPKLHAYRFLRQQAYNAIAEGKIIIWNQPFTDLEIFNKVTDRLRAHAAEHHATLPILVVEVELDPAAAKARVTTRKQQGGHGPSDATFERFAGTYSSFAGHGYQTLTVRGDEDTSRSVVPITKALDTLG